MLVRNTENIGIYMQNVFKKLTISSLWGPKRPQEFLLRLNNMSVVQLYGQQFLIAMQSKIIERFSLNKCMCTFMNLDGIILVIYYLNKVQKCNLILAKKPEMYMFHFFRNRSFITDQCPT